MLLKPAANCQQMYTQTSNWYHPATDTNTILNMISLLHLYAYFMSITIDMRIKKAYNT